MKKLIIFCFSATIFIGIAAFNSLGPGNGCSVQSSTGAPDGVCGDPMGGNVTCKTAGCHAIGPNPATQTGWITSNVPGTGYVPGTVYSFTATAVRPNHTRFGFEVSPQNTSGTPLGTLIVTDATNTALTSTNYYITHTSAGTIGTSGFHTWTFNWQAPPAGSGKVTFYGAFNITNYNSATTGDTIMVSTLAINEGTSPLTTSISSYTNVTCNGACNGAANASASGGTSPYTYAWSNGHSGSSVTSLCPGTYTVVVTDAAAATATATVNITQPPAITVTATQTNVACNGSATGSANASAAGGTGTLSYTWSNGQTTATATNLAAGNYTVTVKDANLCTKTATVSITQPPAVTVTTTQTNVACNGSSTGIANASASGGTGTLSYSWSNGQTAATATNLAAGNYTVTVSDANLCTKTATVNITQPPAITVTTTQTNVTCNGGSTGSASASASGGTGTLSYSWSNGQTTATATNLAAGNYTVTVSDANLCTKTATVSITQPPAITVSTTQTNVACNGSATGSANASASGGTGTLSYSWSNGQTTATAANLAAGNYTVTVTDANLCTKTATVSITQPLAITVSTTQTNVACNGSATGSANAIASGGTGALSYSWSNGQSTATATNLIAGNYTVTVNDANSCVKSATVTISQPLPILISTSSTNASCGASNGSATASASGGAGSLSYLWSNGQTTATVINLAAGNYTVNVTDANNCTNSAVVTVSNSGGPSVSISTQTNVTCNGGNDGSATASATGGTGSLTYSWNTSPVQTSATSTNLIAGIYYVTVTDGAGCISTQSVNITQPTPIGISMSSSVSICLGGCTTMSCSATGGNGGYTYMWQPSSSTASTVNACPAASTDYTVTVTDSKGCVGTNTTSITVNALPAVSLLLNPDTVCLTTTPYTLSGGSPVGGTYSGSGVSSGVFDPSVAGSGTHMIYYSYTDGNSCTNKDSAQILVNTCSTGLLSGKYSDEIKVFPVPSNGILYITTRLDEISWIGVFNLFGEKVFECNKEMNCGSFLVASQSGTTRLTLTHLTDGIYFMRLRTNEGMTEKKFMINK